MKTLLCRTTLGIAAVALCSGLAVGGGDAPLAKAPAPAGKAAGANGNTGTLRSFELTNADPEEVRQILMQIGGSLVKSGSRSAPGIPAPPNTLRMAVDARTHTLFVRGAEKELDAVADLIAVLDADPAKPAPEGKNAQILRLRHAKVPEVVQVLTGLGLQGQVLSLPRTNTLLLIGPEADARDIRAVVEKLDVERKATTAKPPVKKPTPPSSD
jgi:type II secretory pathway component GspD/PulD (secretin)